MLTFPLKRRKIHAYNSNETNYDDVIHSRDNIGQEWQILLCTSDQLIRVGDCWVEKDSEARSENNEKELYDYYRHRKGYKTGSSIIYVQIYHSFNIIKPGNLTKQCQWQGFIGTKKCSTRVTYILSLQKWSEIKGRERKKEDKKEIIFKSIFQKKRKQIWLGNSFQFIILSKY